MVEDYSKLLGSNSLFGGLTKEKLSKVASFLKAENFPKGTSVIKENEVGDRMYLITKGEVEVLKYSKENKATESIAKLAEGDSFGEMELIDIQPRTASVTSLTNLETVSFCNEDLLKLSQEDLETFSIIVVNIARIISRRLRKMDEMMVSIHR